MVATQTLAVGVNLPADCVVVYGTEYFDWRIGDYADLQPEQVQQMIGRAGRPHLSTEGSAWVLCTPRQAQKYHEGRFQVNSQLGKNFLRFLGYAVSAPTTKSEIVQQIARTFMARQVPGEQMEFIADQGLSVLVQLGLVRYDAESGTFGPTETLQLCRQYYVQPQSAFGLSRYLEMHRGALPESYLALLEVLRQFSAEFAQCAQIHLQDVPEL